MKKLNELSPKTKADYSKAAARSLAPSKKYADNYSDAAKASTGKDAKMYQDRSDKNKRDFINRVKGISRANESTDLSQYRKGGSKEGQLPPHLAKFIDPKTGNFTKDAEARIQKGKKSKNFKDVTPKGYGPKESVELDENKATTYLSVYLDHKIMAVHDSKEAGMKYKVGGDGPDGHFLVKTTKSARGVGKFVTRAVGKHLDNQPFPHDDGPHYSVHKESVDEGFMDTMKQLVPGAKGKPAKGKPAKKLNAEQVKISKQIDKKLKLVDSLIQKVKPLGGQISGLMRFSKLPLEKMTPKDLYRVLNDWYKSVEDELDYGNDSVVLSKKYGRSVENLYERMEELALKIKDYMYASGYDVPHGGAKFQNKWLNKVDFSAPKRTDAKWLKMNESVNEGFMDTILGKNMKNPRKSPKNTFFIPFF